MSLDRLTADALTGMLSPGGAGRVVHVRAEPIGTGQMAESARLRLDWAPAGRGPHTVVAKIVSRSARRRRVAAAARAYEIEAGFYTDLAPELSLDTPRCYFARYRSAPLDFCLVLEDLTSLAPGDQLAGCSVDAAAAALEQLARLHAESFVKGPVRLRWLTPGGSGREQARRVGRLVATLGPRFVERYRDHMDDGVVDLIARFAPRAAAYGEDARTPVTVLHGDFRTDNLMFGSGRVAVLDWQTVALGAALSDVSYFLGSSLPTGVRRRAEESLVEHYRDCAVARGLPVGWDDCWSDYRRFAYAGLIMAMTAGTLVAENDRDEEMFALLAARCGQHVIDLEVEPPA